MRLFLLLALSMLCGSALASTATITVTESGGNVLVTGSGSIDLLGLSVNSQGTFGVGAGPVLGLLLTGAQTAATFDNYVGATGPASFGTNCCSVQTSGSGHAFGVNNIAAQTRIVLPQNYVSGTSLSGSSIYAGETVSSMGFTAGTYTYSWAGGTLVINVIAPSAVPSLSEWAQLMLALMVMTVIGWHFHRERSY